MQHAATDLSFAPTRKASPQRFVTVGAVGALHVLAIYALLVAFKVVPLPVPHDTEFRITIPKKIDETWSKPPPNPTAKHIDGPTIVEPRIIIDDGQKKGTITGTLVPPTGPTLPTAGAELLTRSIPPYPMIDVRLGHEGTVTLKLMIDATGVVTDAVVARSSGSDTLDATAVAWVKAKWRYKPAQQNGQAVASTALAAVKFELKNRM